MPPRHGQSQFISPVTGLKAPSLVASSSSSAGSEGEDVDVASAPDCIDAKEAWSTVPLSSEAIDARADCWVLLFCGMIE